MADRRQTTRRHITGKLLQRPEELASAFLESGHTLFCVVDRLGRFVVFNRACEEITGYTFNELRGQSFFTVLDPSEHERIQQLWATRDARATAPDAMDLLWRHKNGAQRLIHWSFSRLDDALGNHEYSAGVGEDVTERRRAEAALRESEELNRRILEAVPGGIVQVGLDGSIRVANQEAQRILGLNFDELSSRYVSDFSRDTLRDDGSPCPVSEYPVTRCLASGKPQPPMTIGVRQRDGHLHWAVFTAVPLHDPATGNPAGAVVTFLDITERKKAEEAMRASEARHRLLIEEASDAICFADESGNNIDANTKACQMFGYSREEFRALNIADTVPPEDRHLIGARFAKMREGIAQRWERELLRKDGTRFPVEISARFLPDRRLLAIMRETTERKRAEEALRESEQRFRLLADAAPVFIWLADRFGRRTYFSRGWLEFTGRALDDELAEGWSTGIHDDDRQRVLDTLAESLFSRQDFTQEYRLRTSDGDFRWVLDHGVVRFTERGEFSGYIGSCLDITERKRAEQALQESERNYRLLMEQASDGIAVFDANRRFLDVNTRFCELMGYDKAELLTLSATVMLPQDAHAIVPARYAELDSGGILRIERDLLRKDDTAMPAEITARRISPGRYLGIIRDVTERRRAEQALRESQRRLATLLSNLPGMAYRCLNDRNWTMVFVSDGTRLVTGLAPSDFMDGKLSFASLIAEEDRERVWNEVQMALAERRSFSLSYRIKRADGRLRWVSEQGQGVYDPEGRLEALEGFIADVHEQREAERALAESDERYKAFIAQSAEGVWRFEFSPPVTLLDDIEQVTRAIIHQGVLAECNDVMARMYGYERAHDILGTRIVDLLDMSDPTNLEQFRALAQSRFRIENMESHEIGRDGGHHYFLNNVIPIFEGGTLRRLWGTQRDITAQKKAAEALRESEERYRRLSGATAEAILIHDQGRILDANQRAADMFGYSPTELLGLSAFMLAEPDSRATVINAVKAGVEVPYEAVGLRKDGSTFPGEITPRNLQLGGKLVRVVAVRDITERKRAEEALRHEAATIRLLQRVATAANETADTQTALREAIEAVCDYTGWGVGHAFLLDKPSNELVPSGVWHESGDADLAAFRRITEATRFAPGVDLPGRVLKNSRPVWVRDVLADPGFVRARATTQVGIRAGFALPVMVGREVAAVLEFYTDQPVEPDPNMLELMANIGTQIGRVIERKRINDVLENRVADRTAQLENANRELSRRAIELEAINRELESFSYSVSHDLRAPLRGIFGFSQALQEDFGDRLDDAGRALLERIKAASQRMARLIDDMLGLSRVTRAEMKPERVDLSALCGEIVAELRKAAPARRVDAIVAPDVWAEGDAHLLRVLLQNLLDNAFKFTSRKDSARIEFGRQSAESETVFFVRDNGAGFEMQYAGKMFGPFQRLHSMKEFEGTGIGLATVQRIVNRHGGRVWAEGRLGEGATFYFTLGKAGT